MAIKPNGHHAVIRLLWITVATGIVLMIIKFIAYYITGSNAILSDALESIVNVSAGIISLIAVSIAAVPRDENHPYGHGKVEFLSAGFEGGMIVLAGLSIIVKAVYNIFFPNEIRDLPVGIGLTALSGAVNYFMGYILVKKGNKYHSAAMIASGVHLKTDTYSTIGLLFGLALIAITNTIWLDQVVAIIFALLILYSGYKILRSALSGILDETDLDLAHKIVDVLQQNRRENWIDVHNLRLIRYGSALHIDCHITLPWYLNLQEAHEEISKIDELINKQFPYNVEFFIHEDPCIPESCKICMKQNCPVRIHRFEGQVAWTIENLLRNQKHSISESR
jgi:cation diffusion facilitator family transporter